MKILATYFNRSRSPFYSLIAALPLLLSYEILLFSINHSDIQGLRNGADIIFKQIFALFNIYGFYSFGFVILLSFSLIYYFSKGAKVTHFEPKFLVLMLLESICYAFLLYWIMQYLGRYSLNSAPSTGNLKFQIVLALGAGVYEEFIFRVVLITGFLFFFRDLLRLHPLIAGTFAILLAAGFFTAFHYLGPYADTFSLRSGLFRLLAGILLGLIFLIRGYGISAYAHTFYDLILIVL